MFRRPSTLHYPALLTDTEPRKNHAQQIIRREFSGDFVACRLGQPQVFGQQLDLVVAAQGGVFEFGFGGGERGEVAAAGEEQAFAFALPADFVQQGLFEQVEASAGFGGKADHGIGAAEAA